MIAGGDEGPHLFAPGRALDVARGTDDRAHLGRHHMSIRMDGNERRASLEREPDAAPRWRRARGGPQPKGLTFELEQLFGVDLAPLGLDTFEHAPFGRR